MIPKGAWITNTGRKKREPLECWATVLSCGNIFSRSQKEAEGWFPDSEVVKLREVIPPEVKTLPDSEGVWWEKDCSAPAMIIARNQGLSIKYLNSTVGFNTLTNDEKGRWIKINNPFEGE